MSEDENNEPIPLTDEGESELIYSLARSYEIFLMNCDILRGYPDGVLSSVMKIPNAWLYSFRNLDSVSEEQREFLFNTNLSLPVCGFISHLFYTEEFQIEDVKEMLPELKDKPEHHLELIREKLGEEEEGVLTFDDVIEAALEEKYFKQLWDVWAGSNSSKRFKTIFKDMERAEERIARKILSTCYNRGFFGEKKKDGETNCPTQAQVERLIQPIWIDYICEKFFAPKLIESCPHTTALLSEFIDNIDEDSA